jgi:hypothetical protein
VQEQKYFRKGFKMRDDVQHLLDRDYRSEVVETIRNNGNVLEADGLTLRLADEFGFCYGVDRAVDYAFQTRQKFPNRRIFITGDVIHNPTINGRLKEIGVRFLADEDIPVERSLDRLTRGRADTPGLWSARRVGRQAQGDGMHRGGYHLRLCALCMEAR